MCVNTVVVAAPVTTLTTEIVQLIPDSNTGIALHSQWRCSTCGALLPATSVHVEHLHTGEKLTLLSAIVHLRHSILVSAPQDGMPQVHDSAEKRQFFSSVEVFDVNTGCWEQRTTRGTPPLGVKGYSCVAVRNELHYFGGECGHRGCYHNSVHTH